ncbi:MAG TPA: hypothetical protein VN653_10825 [Anaerolineales bacterium]|nr:hypothetical protein [Anaerolineales bacterium]
MHCGGTRRWFLEGIAIGLISDLYPMADNLQHGELAQIGGLLSTLVSAQPSKLRINLNKNKHLDLTTHMLLIANMTLIGPHFQISSDVSFKDSHLDVFTFSDMSKINMFSYAVLSSRESLLENADNKHYRAKYLKIVSDPPMAVLGDGVLLGQGPFSVRIHPRALAVMAGKELTGQPALTRVEKPRSGTQ